MMLFGEIMTANSFAEIMFLVGIHPVCDRGDSVDSWPYSDVGLFVVADRRRVRLYLFGLACIDDR